MMFCLTRTPHLAVAAIIAVTFPSLLAQNSGPPSGKQKGARRAAVGANAMKAQPLERFNVPAGVKLVPDVAYREGNPMWKLDLALPEERSSTPRPAVCSRRRARRRHRRISR
jgi:hypothetical protein